MEESSKKSVVLMTKQLSVGTIRSQLGGVFETCESIQIGGLRGQLCIGIREPVPGDPDPQPRPQREDDPIVFELKLSTDI